MHFLYTLLCALPILSINAWPDPRCRTPPPASNYTIEKYTGRWFEIGRIQTAGGAFFQRDCVCTYLDVAQNVKNTSLVSVSNICRKKTPDGELLVANGTLFSNQQPANGRYNETIDYTRKIASYNIIVLQENEYSVEYDCVEELGITNYCVHVLSRQPTLNQTMVDSLLKIAQQYDLNPNKLDFIYSKQQNCTYNP